MLSQRTQISPRRLAWLDEQLAAWTADDLVGEDQARAIRGRYERDTRASLVSLASILGATFLGIGVLWLIATNVDYDALSPGVRFAFVAALWLGFTVGGASVRRFGAPLRVLGALLFGGVVFQAAQSLNVPAYEPVLLLAWAGGALALAYGTRSVGPLVVGVTAGVGWYGWVLLRDSESATAIVAGLALAAPVLMAAAVAHRGDRMAGPWRRCACLVGLLSLFVVAFARGAFGDGALTRPVYAGIAVALIASVVAASRADRTGLIELAAAGGIAAAALLLVVTAPIGPGFLDSDELAGASLLHALVASVAFLLAAVAVAAIGVVRETPGLVNLAAGLLVLFVTLQSFGLFAPLLSGAGLFLLVGTLLVATALLVDRGRRRLREEINS